MSEKSKIIYHRSLVLLSFILIIGLGFYIHNNTSTFILIKNIRLDIVLALILIHVINYWLLGLTHKLPLKKHQINLKFKEWYGLCMVSELFNMLLPAKGGTGIRMLYINDKKKLAMREFLSMSFAIVLIGFTLLGLIGLAYCQIYLKKTHIVFSLLESVFLALSISGIILMFMTEAISKLFKFKRRYSPKNYLKDLKLTSIVSLCWIGMFVLYPVKVYLSFKAIGIDLNFYDSFEISLVLLAASLFQVLPGNIGVKEIVTAYIGRQYGIDFEVALLASIIDRAILLLFLFPVGFYFYWELFLESSLPRINWARIGASSLIPLRKRLLKVR
ncbi:MAG: flippase-like domain-containing protein [Bacteriovoracaceae bacterium]|nr:flippase-like domain-containing protein [Bacteriovoracaceae bacterium]